MSSHFGRFGSREIRRDIQVVLEARTELALRLGYSV
jgi:hypothetical protein